MAALPLRTASPTSSRCLIGLLLRRRGDAAGRAGISRQRRGRPGSDTDAQPLSTPVADAGRGGNPPALLRLQDGRLCLIYGFRDAPFAMHARLSEDDGASWSSPITLRQGAGNHDLGYPRAIQRLDGTVVTAYYFNDHPDEERYIAATLWRP